MRRVLAVVALVGALFTATACGTEAEPTATATSAAATSAPAGKKTADVCSTLEPKVVGWATEIAGLKAVTSKSTSAEIEAYFAAFRAATAKLVTSLQAAGGETADAAFKQALAGLSTYLENANKAYTTEAVAKGGKNPFESPEFEAAAGEPTSSAPERLGPVPGGRSAARDGALPGDGPPSWAYARPGLGWRRMMA